MKIFKFQKNVLNIQKCSLPDSDFSKQNYGSYCVITIPESFFGIIVKIGLSVPKQISGGFLCDNSVITFKSSYRTKRPVELKNVDYHHFVVLPPPSSAITVNVRIVFNDVATVINQKKQGDRLRWMVKEILKLYTFSTNSVIYLENLTQCKKFGFYCIDIIDINDHYQCKLEDINIYKCSEDTKVNVIECIQRKKYEMCYCSREEIKLGGLAESYTILKEIIEFSKNRFENLNVKLANKILVSGPAGCGKTSLIHNVVKDTKTLLLEVLLPEICSSFPGETEQRLQNVFSDAKLNFENEENCVILIEDIDVLCGKRSTNVSSNLKRCMNKLVSLLEEFDNFLGIVIIGTATNLEDVDPQLRRAKCFDDELLITPPTEEDRQEIIRNILEHFEVKCSQGVIGKFALWTPGFVGADLHLAVQECVFLYHKTKGHLNELDDHLLESCFKKVLSNITPTALKESVGLLASKDVDFSTIGGLNDIKKLLDFYVKEQLLNPEMFMRIGIPLTKGILLYGPPGCAKTTLVKALARESNMTFLSASSADLYSPYVGDPEKKIIQLFSQARAGAPAIIFIDEIDGLVGSKSGDRMRGVQERVLSTLLVEMDGVSVRAYTQKDSPLKSLSGFDEKESSFQNIGNKIVVIGATNRPERLDDALKRPGRFDKIVYVPPPDKEERLNILKKLTERMPLDSTVDLELLANTTDYYSGADLKNLCYESAIFALTETEMKATTVAFSHFQRVLARMRPSLNSKMINFYESFQKNIH